MSTQNHLNQPTEEPEHTSPTTVSHNPFLAHLPSAPPAQQAEKHIVYFDDYGASPPSYDVAQEGNNHNESEQTTIQTADADYHRSHDIPLHTYSQDTSFSVSDTAPLMMEEAQLSQSDYTPSAPSLDQVEDNRFESMDDKTPKKKRKLTLTRLFLACCVWFAGITFMSVSLFGYECFDKCQTDEDCHGCLMGIRKGGLSLVYAFFILACVFATYKAVRFTLTA
ncbi:unnamed protein product [Mucor circinelloides]